MSGHEASKGQGEPATPGYFSIEQDAGGLQSQSHLQQGYAPTIPRSASPASARSEKLSPTPIFADSIHHDMFSGHVQANSWSALSPMSADSEQRSLMSPYHRRKHQAHDLIVDDRHILRSARASIASEDSVARTSAFSEDGVNAPVIISASVTVGEFTEFIGACQMVEEHLTSFTNDVQRLGSVMHLVRAARELHKALMALRLYIQDNAQNLGILMNKIRASKSGKQQRKRRKRRGMSLLGKSTASSVSDAGAESFVGSFIWLAESVSAFAMSVSDFDDYNNEEANRVLSDFEIELRVLAGALEYFSADGEYNELRRFVTARASALKSNLEDLSKALTQFQEVGIPCISFGQKRATRMLLNASTVATFFAGVAATTIQYSIQWPTMNSTMIAVNTLWFSSMVLAIGAAITGMLAMTWRQAVFSSPKHLLPWYIRFWIRSGYLSLLIASVITFLAGIVAFSFDTLPRSSGWVITAFTVFCAVGLMAVTILFAQGRLSFSRLRSDIKRELAPGLERMYESSERGWAYWIKFHIFDQLSKKRHTITIQTPEEDTSWEEFSTSNRIWFWIRYIFWRLFRKNVHRTMSVDSEAVTGGDGTAAKRPQAWRRGSKYHVASRLDSIGRSHTDPLKPMRNRRTEEADAWFSQWYKEQLQLLDVKNISEVTTRVMHMSFSPDGHWLAVCYKYECCIFNVLKNFEYHKTLKHTQKNAVQVEWAPAGTKLVTRTVKFIKIWKIDENEDFIAVRKALRFRTDELTDIQWSDDDVFLVIADERIIYRVDTSTIPETRRKYILDTEELELYYLYTVPKSTLVFIVCARTIKGLPEDKAIDCIIVYEMDDVPFEERSFLSRTSYTFETVGELWYGGEIKRRIPLLHEPESLSFASSASVPGGYRRMIISYLDKPPEVWEVLTSVNDGVNVRFAKELVRKSEPDEKQEADAEWGDAYLFGPSESIVACAEDDKMFFWDLNDPNTNGQFHRLNVVEEKVEELPIVAWTVPTKEKPYPMLATAGKTFPMRIWTPTQELQEPHTANCTKPDGSNPEHINAAPKITPGAEALP